MNTAFTAETVHLGLISGQTKRDYKNWYLKFLCLAFNNKKDNLKPPTCVVDWRADDRLTPKGSFADPGQGNLVNNDEIILTAQLLHNCV